MILPPLPPHPGTLPWPTDEWAVADPPAGVSLERLLDDVMADDGPLARTYAAVVVHRGRIVGERYSGALPHLDRPDEPVESTTLLLSWSIAKSMLHAAVGMLVAEGRLRLDAPPGVPGWRDPGDPRRAIEHGSFWANGYEGQSVLVSPGADLVVVRLGKTDAARYPALKRWRADVVRAFAGLSASK